MAKKLDRNQKREKKHLIIRKKVYGTSQRPRLCFYRSNRNINAQIIDDDKQKTLISAYEKGKNTKHVIELAKIISSKAKKAKIIDVVFDRSGYLYFGRIKTFADKCREGGLKF